MQQFFRPFSLIITARSNLPRKKNTQLFVSRVLHFYDEKAPKDLKKEFSFVFFSFFKDFESLSISSILLMELSPSKSPVQVSTICLSVKVILQFWSILMKVSSMRRQKHCCQRATFAKYGSSMLVLPGTKAKLNNKLHITN